MTGITTTVGNLFAGFSPTVSQLAKVEHLVALGEHNTMQINAWLNAAATAPQGSEHWVNALKGAASLADESALMFRAASDSAPLGLNNVEKIVTGRTIRTLDMPSVLGAIAHPFEFLSDSANSALRHGAFTPVGSNLSNMGRPVETFAADQVDRLAHMDAVRGAIDGARSNLGRNVLIAGGVAAVFAVALGAILLSKHNDQG